MDKEKAIAKAEAFKDDWEIDRLEGTAYHKPTGFKLSLGRYGEMRKASVNLKCCIGMRRTFPGPNRI